ncbi:proline reductase cluster protein PrdD [Candidatus Enterococcus ferrettii]|uniref:D-proline reductase (Dithiol)-stabilizing protein PrdD n=1 Tax=Candidatus Enterococcus ferrettii TaxID=2815324 RepID=A0ABV0ES03_9ENTE|nr:proline reductase cluster protein PrdD [Enterococcus sp. 665A]MBO1340401.1 proline reductase cluster protein PrdD [Enterococcus sp. 665A]
MTTLTIKSYHINNVQLGEKNLVLETGSLTLSPKLLFFDHPLIEAITIKIIPPDSRNQFTNTIMDVIPLSAKALGSLGEGITHTLTGVYVLLTGVDTNGRQICNGGGSEGILAEQVAWGRAGTPADEDFLISFNVVLKADAWVSRAGPDAAHLACDQFCAVFRQQLRAFDPQVYTEKHVFDDHPRPNAKQVVLVKEVSGQGAIYDTRLFPTEPAGFQGSKSIIDMGCMPQLVTPNEYRDGIIRAMD